ncbi:6-phosphofructo-2-kinase/fructose-2,6-bisphosphatase-like protein isoform X1, partial [Tanacetum coccineum]
VRLPASGKTFVAAKLTRYLRWLGHYIKHFNVGKYQRLKHGANLTANFFRGDNTEGMAVRNEVAALSIDVMIAWMQEVIQHDAYQLLVVPAPLFGVLVPADYEPPFIRGCTEDETHNTWAKNHLKMEVGNVNNKHFVLALKDDNVSLGADSMQEDGDSDADSEVKQPEKGKQNVTNLVLFSCIAGYIDLT